MNDARRLIPGNEQSIIVSHTMMRFCNLRADVRYGKISDPQEILAKALELDGILLDFERKMPPDGWPYETIFTDEISDYVWKGRYHVYLDHWIAQIWNGLRVVRIMANEMVRSILLDGFRATPPTFNLPEHTAQFQISTDTLYSLMDDIMYSVVQHIGYFPKPSENFQHRSVESKRVFELHQETTASRMCGGTFLLWPLYLVGNIDTATAPAINFAAKNLELIGDRMGIAQAHVLAQLVKSRTDFEEFREIGELQAEVEEMTTI